MATTYIGNMFGIGNVFLDKMAKDYLSVIGFIIPIGIVLSTPIIKIIKEKLNINNNFQSILQSCITFAILILSIFSCVSSSYNPFIYFNF